ncbi:Neuronal acetylcholine receptor subunit alpha-7 [Stylophora pistillata]|uniref:Neuronal acetylcholine receptor subunit alpha-7 n=2 Tax=Stylophora pistillata TaxID=50429 RepID=A0A2B4SDG7_STYPI|nr:Neuronal acetylcholine receptor subunit alpha-7 [Stylophora pistillata]
MKKFVPLLAFISYVKGAVKSNQTQLYIDLFQNYNKYNHPTLRGADPVKVVFDFQLIRIIDVSAKDQFIKPYAWVNQYWNNPQLRWDPKKYNGIKEIHIQPSDVWVPDILLYNNVDEEDRFAGGKYTYKTNIALKYDGNSTWLSPAIFKSICKVDVTYFPFDEQDCSLKFGSWSFDSSKVDLHTHSGSMLNNNYVKNGEWKLTLLKSQRNKQKYQCCSHEFIDVTIQMQLQRESLDYILKLIIPCSLISSMIFLGFVLPPESGERIGLSITVLLAMTVFQQLSSELMPSYGFPLLGQYYFACMIEIGASLVVTTLILNFYHRNSRRMPRVLRVVILKWLARVVFPKRSAKDWEVISTNVEAPNCKSTANGNEEEGSSDSEQASLFVAESLLKHDESKVYSTYSDPWIPLEKKNNFGLPANGISHYQNTNGRAYGTISGNRTRHSRYKRKTSFPNSKMDTRRKTSRNHGCTHHQSPEKRGSSIGATSIFFDLFQDTEDSELSPQMLKNQKEWIKAARVLDRLFLIISILIGVTTLFGLFLKAPRFH